MTVGSPAITLVGELNPHSTRPGHALYPYPAHCSGGRLAKVLGLTPEAYLERFPQRVNLCVGRWDRRQAEASASQILHTHGLRTPAGVVLLGRRVAEVFGLTSQPFSSFQVDGRLTVLELPHPSGLCRLWNDPRNWRRARAEVLKLAADLWIYPGFQG